MDELLNILSDQRLNLQGFLVTAQKQQRALVESNVTSLEECILSEEVLLNRIEATEKMREEIMNKLALAYSIKLKSLSISDFLEQIGNVNHSLIEKITELSNELKSIMKQINKINFQNNQLINHSRNFIKETVNVILGNNGNQLLDKRL